MDSETDFSSDSDYDNEIVFVDDILQPFQFEPIFTAAEIQAKKPSFSRATRWYSW